MGADILDEEKDLRPGPGGVSPAMFNLRDAVVLSDIDDAPASAITQASEFDDSQEKPKAERLYVSGLSQAFIAPDAIPAIVEHVDPKSLTPFERHVMEYVDGRRPVERIERRSGLNNIEVRTALANLADRGVVKIVGRAFADNLPIDDSIEIAPEDNIFAQVTQSIIRRTSSSTITAGMSDLHSQANPEIEDLFKTKSIVSPLNSGRAKRALPTQRRRGRRCFFGQRGARTNGADFQANEKTAEVNSFKSAFNRSGAKSRTGVTKAEAMIYDEARHLEKKVESKKPLNVFEPVSL